MAHDLWIAKTPLGHSVRLSEAGWSEKIQLSHPEFSSKPQYIQEVRHALEDPDFVVKGWEGELLSLRWCAIAPNMPKYICVVYRPAVPVGFVITAFFISRYGKLLRRGIQWQKKQT